MDHLQWNGGSRGSSPRPSSSNDGTQQEPTSPQSQHQQEHGQLGEDYHWAALNLSLGKNKSSVLRTFLRVIHYLSFYRKFGEEWVVIKHLWDSALQIYKSKVSGASSFPNLNFDALIKIADTFSEKPLKIKFKLQTLDCEVMMICFNDSVYFFNLKI